MLALAPANSDLQWQIGKVAEDLTRGIDRADLRFYLCLGRDAAALALAKADPEHWHWEALNIDRQESLRPFFAGSLSVVSSCEASFSDLVHRPYRASYSIVESLLVVRQELGEGKGWRLLPPLFTNVDSSLPARIANVMQQALQQLPGAFFDFLSDPYVELVGAGALEQAGLVLHVTDEERRRGRLGLHLPQPGVGRVGLHLQQPRAGLHGWQQVAEGEETAGRHLREALPAGRHAAPPGGLERGLAPEAELAFLLEQALQHKCLAVAERWLEDHGGLTSDDEPEVQARRLRDHAFTVSLLENFDRHPGMRGALIEVGGQPCALTIVEAEGNVLLSHVEKSILCPDKDGWRGIYPFARRAYLSLWDKEELVNAEQDTGCPGLRDSKRRYRPLELRRKWRVAAAPS